MARRRRSNSRASWKECFTLRQRRSKVLNSSLGLLGHLVWTHVQRRKRALSKSIKSQLSGCSGTGRKPALSAEKWKGFFLPDGRLRDGGIRLLNIARRSGVDPDIRIQVWPFLLGVFEFGSSREEREDAKTEKRNEYDRLRKQCYSLHATMTAENKSGSAVEDRGSNASDSMVAAKDLLSMEKETPASNHSATHSPTLLGRPSCSEQVQSSTAGPSNRDTKSYDSDMLDVDEITKDSPMELDKDNVDEITKDSQMDLDKDNVAEVVATSDVRPDVPRADGFNTWQKTIRLDARRADGDWVEHSPWQAAIPLNRALLFAEGVGLEDCGHLEPRRIYHAARLVAILEAYAIHDNEIGYCQGMSDLLTPIIAMMDEDFMAFWCFVGSMKKARQNFINDETGIQQQLDFISKIIKHKDDQLYSHLKQLKAEECLFAYRMVLVLLRKELTFEQTVQLWEVIWADQAAVKAGIEKSAESVIKQQAPPTDDLLLYVIAASVLQRRKRIIEEHSSMDEIHLECNKMSGQLDIWKLLDDARDLVITLHDKIKSDV